MATRSSITVEGLSEVKVYKHWDGYPEATLPWLKKFNKEFAEKRGDDPSYKFAQLLRSSVRDAEEFGLDTSAHTGWGVVPRSAKYGEVFRYFLKTDGTVEVNQAKSLF